MRELGHDAAHVTDAQRRADAVRRGDEFAGLLEKAEMAAAADQLM